MKKKYKFSNIKKYIFKFILYFVGIFFVLLPLWLYKKFGFLYLDQFLFNLKLIIFGHLGGDVNLVKSAIRWLIVIPIIFSFLLIFINIITSFFIKNREKSIDHIIKMLRIIKKNYYNLKLNFFFKIFDKVLNKFLFIIFISISAIFFLMYTDFFKSNNNYSKHNFLDENYIFPDVKIKSEKKNLVVLYVESLENTFSNKERFGENLLEKIWTIDKTQSIEYFYQIPGSGFTLSSLIASQCGIPLLNLGKTMSDPLKIIGINKYLPNLKCLTDILHDHNYENIFISSDHLENSLTNNYLITHNFSRLLGIEELKNMGYQTSKNAWHNKNNWYGGIHDNILLHAAIDELKKLKKNKKNNFFMTIMTLDTHAPVGYPNKNCLKKILNKADLFNYEISDSVKCTVNYINNFINEFNKLNLKNTRLIIVGDHLFMGDLKVKNRYIYNKFFFEKNLKIRRNSMNFYDLYPTFLEAMDFKINNEYGKVGLGYSIFSRNKNYQKIDFKMKGNSKLYDQFWGIDG
tara:strand:+ start:51 stop:1598 length:1548 start_codon:yes stop_codon:yes gene_type:complete